MNFSRRSLLKSALLASAASALPARAGWQRAANLPYRVQEIYPVLHEGKIYVAGGISPDKSESNFVARDVAVYSLSENSWKVGTRLPEPRHHPHLVSHQGILYAFSGFILSGADRWYASGDVLWLDESEGQVAKWKKLKTKMPHPLCETVATSYQGRIHLVSGRKPLGKANGRWQDHVDVNSHWLFDTAENRWSQAKPVPTARNSAAGVCLNNQWFVFGGRTVNGGNLAVNEVYDFKSDRWEKRAPMPQAQGGLAAAAIKDRIYVFGGEFFDNGGGVFKEVWEYSVREDHWRKVGEMPLPRHGLGAVAYDDSIFVIAGATKASGNGTSDRMSVFRL
ncbi:kelch repeat-containing protein [Aliikangiella sp. G2MR2-5]|uniref:Kelch repeat-containing protein n=1 Tax=Aliikangiella sp. G2MR2-5 TaxID=2788943 RepID=UPI0018ABC241|nr:kelch repeat-containing protein [Aliikangiella sp. G2MR2-5]